MNRTRVNIFGHIINQRPTTIRAFVLLLDFYPKESIPSSPRHMTWDNLLEATLIDSRIWRIYWLDWFVSHIITPVFRKRHGRNAHRVSTHKLSWEDWREGNSKIDQLKNVKKFYVPTICFFMVEFYFI